MNWILGLYITIVVLIALYLLVKFIKISRNVESEQDTMIRYLNKYQGGDWYYVEECDTYFDYMTTRQCTVKDEEDG